MPLEKDTVHYISKLQHPLKEVVMALRKVILESDDKVGEQVKWNSLAFYYIGEMKPFNPKEYKRDIVVFNLNKTDFVLLIFPTGATIRDTSGLLEGNFPDGRKMVKFRSVKEVETRKKDLQKVIKDWLVLGCVDIKRGKTFVIGKKEERCVAMS